jgi:hypothetical protein
VLAIRMESRPIVLNTLQLRAYREKEDCQISYQGS